MWAQAVSVAQSAKVYSLIYGTSRALPAMEELLLRQAGLPRPVAPRRRLRVVVVALRTRPTSLAVPSLPPAPAVPRRRRRQGARAAVAARGCGRRSGAARGWRAARGPPARGGDVPRAAVRACGDHRDRVLAVAIAAPTGARTTSLASQTIRAIIAPSSKETGVIADCAVASDTNGPKLCTELTPEASSSDACSCNCTSQSLHDAQLDSPPFASPCSAAPPPACPAERAARLALLRCAAPSASEKQRIKGSAELSGGCLV